MRCVSESVLATHTSSAAAGWFLLLCTTISTLMLISCISLYIQIMSPNYSCRGTLVCWVIVTNPPSIVFLKSQHFSPHLHRPSTKVAHVCVAGQSSRFINISPATMGSSDAHPSDSKAVQLSCQSHIQEGGMCGEYTRCRLFVGN